MLTIEILLGLNENKGDVTTAFPHSNIAEGENIYVNISKGIENYSKTGCKRCLKLKKKLNGFFLSPRIFWQ